MARSDNNGGRQRNADPLPRPDPAFTGKIGRTREESVPEQPKRTMASPNSPNILVILLDDVGFAQTGTFGGLTPTPALDRLASEGLSYNTFHTCAICTPTRAAILTGRNAHLSGGGTAAEMTIGFPGHNCAWPKSVCCVAEILRQNGYATAAFGKWHNTPNWETGPNGPFDRWPNGQGFEYFYGFNSGATNQWEPTLFENTSPVIHHEPRKDYHLTTEMADRSISWIRTLRSVDPDRPFFLWFATGATHAPHHAPKDWISRFRGQFDEGWDRYREIAFQRQKDRGIIPQDSELTPRPSEIPAWDSLSDDERRLYARMMEIFAAFTAHTDYEIGRVTEEIRQLGIDENTLIFYVVGDNGASGEGGLSGNANGLSYFNGAPETVEMMLKQIDTLGGAKHYNHFPAGWAWAMNTPFKWVKRVASHLGGVRNPLVVSWPRVIKDRGGLREQFHHAVDLGATILDAAGLELPPSVNGAPQRPLDGVSMLYTFDDAKAENRRTRQYFEAFSNRAMYEDGWWAGSREVLPWISKKEPLNLDQSQWELYNLERDFTQARDLASEHPEKLRKLQDLFWIEASLNSVLPLDPGGSARMLEAQALGKTPRARYTYYPGAVGIIESAAPDIKNKSFSIRASITMGTAEDAGVLVALGGRIGGYSLFVRDRHATFWYNFCGMEQTVLRSEERLSLGESEVAVDFEYDGGGNGLGGSLQLFINGSLSAQVRLERTVARIFARETFDIGMDLNSPVGDYESPFPFTGTIHKIDFALKY